MKNANDTGGYRRAGKALGLNEDEWRVLFAGTWQSLERLFSVPEALRKLADGASVEEVSA